MNFNPDELRTLLTGICDCALFAQSPVIRLANSLSLLLGGLRVLSLKTLNKLVLLPQAASIFLTLKSGYITFVVVVVAE